MGLLLKDKFGNGSLIESIIAMTEQAETASGIRCSCTTAYWPTDDKDFPAEVFLKKNLERVQGLTKEFANKAFEKLTQK